MKKLISIVCVLGAALAIGRGLDLALWTDASTGLCLAGSVWLRYIGLGVAVLAAVLVGRAQRPSPNALNSQCTPSAVLAAGAALMMGLSGVLRLLLAVTGIASIVRAVLELLCALWLATVARSWFKSRWHRPTRSLTPAVAGSALFYWCVLARFMENSSSWQRVTPTAAVWQMLAALLFLTGLIRMLYLPGTADGRGLCASALACFVLCLCWEIPTLALQAVTAAAEGDISAVPDLTFGVGLCCLGTLGLACAARCEKSRAAARHQHAAG